MKIKLTAKQIIQVIRTGKMTLTPQQKRKVLLASPTADPKDFAQGGVVGNTPKSHWEKEMEHSSPESPKIILTADVAAIAKKHYEELTSIPESKMPLITGNVFRDNKKANFVGNSKGFCEVIEPPKPGVKYFIGVDGAASQENTVS